MTDLIIPVQLRDVLGNYLAQKPYGEVAQLINALAALKPASSQLPQSDTEPGR